MKYLGILILLLSFTPHAAAQTISEMEEMCLETCGPPAWQIATPVGEVEMTRDGDILLVSVLVRPSSQGYYMHWTAEMPASLEADEPDSSWLHLQPELLVLEWTIEQSALEYVPAVTVDRGLTASAGRSGRVGEVTPQPAVTRCDCDVYHEQIRETPEDIETSEWSFMSTTELALLRRVEAQCHEYVTTSSNHVISNSSVIGWIMLEDGSDWIEWSRTVRRDVLAGPLNGSWRYRRVNCPPPVSDSVE